MKIVGKRDEFLDWLEKLRIGGEFDEVAVKVTKDGIYSSTMEDTLYRFLKYTKLKVVEEGAIKFQANKLYQTIDKLFNDDEKITVYDDNDTLIATSGTIERRQPLFTLNPDENIDKITFKVENNTPYLRIGGKEERQAIQNKITISNTTLKKIVDISSLQDIIARWRFLVKDGKLIIKVGDIANNKDVIKLTPEKVVIKQEKPHDLSVDFGLQFKPIPKVFKTDVNLFFENNTPAIFHEYTMDYDLWIMVANLAPEEEYEPPIEEKVEEAEKILEEGRELTPEEKEEFL